MMDVDALFACFEESTSEQTAIQFTNPKDFESTVNEINTLSICHKRPHEEVPCAGTTKKAKHEDDDYLTKDLDLKLLNSKIVIHTIETNEGCTHEVVIPAGEEYTPLLPISVEPAKQYNFILDPFQKEAILCIDNLQSVLVSAHTSAGKTVVAEYAVALSLKNKQRVIYTTPIKALSNQKYREFSEEFHDVGLITGDVTINPSASCLIMTTEILRNMLYRGSEITREVGWVIFDEIHYMRDKERGVVWEETLILLPDNVHYVFLSATIPNARQFAEWVCRMHSQPCHVVYTEYRPTPLQHYLYPAGGDGIHLVVNEKGEFREDNFNTAMAIVSNAGEAGKGDQRGRNGGPRDANQSNVFGVVNMIMQRNFAPVIVFSFSKKHCETYAMEMAKMDFNTVEEKNLIQEVFDNAVDLLSEEDRKLPQVESIIPMLRRGIGIHHGGLLPIVKETVEILFGLGLIKALFATETFAMGLNMPARTVVFTNCKKFDGKDFRFITSGEYIQMSGRAGRRGLDDNGIVILMIDQKVTPAAVKCMVQGKADPINSAFHLTYNMILNLLRVSEINPEYMLERSFFQFQNEAAIPDLVKNIKAKQKEYNAVSVDQEQSVATYHHIKTQLDILDNQFRPFITQPKYLKPFLNTRRVVKIKTEKYEYDWGMIVNYKNKTDRNSKGENSLTSEETLIVNVLLNVKKSTKDDEKAYIPCPPGERGDAVIVPVPHTHIYRISSTCIKEGKIAKDLRPADNRKYALRAVAEVKKFFPNGLPLVDPILHMKIADPAFKDIVEKIKQLEERLHAHPLYNDKNVGTLSAAYERKLAMHESLMQARSELEKAKSILQMEELKRRKRVLRRLGYCTAADVIELKGRIACELSSADELLLTEMVFNGVFNKLSAEHCAAVLSCFVCDESSSHASSTAEELKDVLRQLQEYARRIAKISIEAKLDLDEDEYVAKFKYTLMDVVLAWCKGATFLQICKITDVYEGSIIRSFRRLEEVLRQLCQVAKNIGSTDLENKFSDAVKMLKRDIIFAASLYM